MWSYENKFDEIGRISEILYIFGNEASAASGAASNTTTSATSLARYDYSPNGRLMSVTLSDNSLLVNYARHTNGMVRSITAPKFVENLTYNYKTGNIATQQWRGVDNISRRYSYTYDNANRLTVANYTDIGAQPNIFNYGAPNFTTRYTYDLNSNVQMLLRNGISDKYPIPNGNSSTLIQEYGAVDKLILQYEGNRVIEVFDQAAETVFNGATDYNDGSKYTRDFLYDCEGRLAVDEDRGIADIIYNSLSQPTAIVLYDGVIEQTYSADGRLLRRTNTSFFTETSSETNVLHTDYVNDAVCTNGTLTRLVTPTGFCTSSGVQYYHITDHLGNIRQVVDSAGIVHDEYHYYPYGLPFAESYPETTVTNTEGSTTAITTSGNPYLFGGKEWHTTFGLDTYDFSARHYSPQLARFLTPDPLTPSYPSLSPYAYCAANPISLIDPTGCEILFSGEIDDINETISIINKYIGNYGFAYINAENKRLNIELNNNSIQEITTPFEYNYCKTIAEIVNHPKDVFIEVGHNLPIVIGDAQQRLVDIGDIKKLGDGKWLNQGSALLHELYEQYSIQAKGYHVNKAHAHASMRENIVTGVYIDAWDREIIDKQMELKVFDMVGGIQLGSIYISLSGQWDIINIDKKCETLDVK